jgi:hypothetical protein
MKTYAAASGYVYHYYYLGQRPSQSAAGHGVEYVFEASTDRRKWHAVSVLLPEKLLAEREAQLGRALVPAERYAISKLTLFQAFDDRSDVRGELLVGKPDLDSILETLGID